MTIRQSSLIGILAWGLISSVGVLAGTDAKPVDIRDLMTASQYQQSGLDKLTPEQLQALNGWLNDYLAGHGATGAVAPGAPAAPVAVPVSRPSTAAPAANFGKEMLPVPAETTADRIETHVAGLFTGWNGETVFTLANGQVWKQSGPGYFDVRLHDPSVVIKKLAIGYLLTVPGYGDTVFVRRIK